MRNTILAAVVALAAWGAAETASAQTNDMAGSYQLNQPPVGTYPLNQPLVGTYQLNQPPVGTYQLNQPLVGTYPLNQPLTGTYDLSQPLTGTYDLQQSLTGSNSLYQPLPSTLAPMGSSSLTGGSSAALDMSYVDQQSMDNYVQQPTATDYGYQPPPLGTSLYEQQPPSIVTTPLPGE